MKFENSVCLSTRTIYLGGSVSEEMSKEVIQALHILAQDAKKRPIQILINSNGGDDDEMMAIYDAIKHCPCPTGGVVIGNCLSAAATILQACNLRLLSQNAKLMIHSGTAGINKNHQHEVAVMGKQLDKDLKRFYKIMSERSGMSASKIKKLCRFSTYFTPEEAVKAGFADEILPIYQPQKKVLLMSNGLAKRKSGRARSAARNNPRRKSK